MDNAHFTQKHDDINLTKEEAEFLEHQFYKYLRNEMENNSSNWREFYDILKEETANQTHSNDTKTHPDLSNSAHSSYHENTQPPPKGGFKVNPERTKQEYKNCPENSKWQKAFNAGHQKKQSSKQKTSENKPTPKQNDTHKKAKRGTETQPRKTFPKAKVHERVEKKTKDEEYYQHPQSLPVKIFKILKEIVVIFVCFALTILLYGLNILWNVTKTVLKVAVLLMLFILARSVRFSLQFGLVTMQWCSQVDERFQITANLVRYYHNSLELIHLVLGVNLKGFFTFKKNSKSEATVIDDGPPPPLPENSVEAIKFLTQGNEDKPYRVLCVHRSASAEEIKTNYRKLVRLVHPDKCNDKKSEDAFKVLDTAFKKLSNPETRQEHDQEMDRQRAWEEYNKSMGDEYKNLFEHLLNTIPCSKCENRHKKELVKDRAFYNARYCAQCNINHAARDGEVWAEVGLLGIKWRCYACIDAEIYDVTDWAVCQGLKKTMPVNDHKVYFRFGTSSSNRKERRKKRAQEEKVFEAGEKQRKGKKGRKKK